MTCVEAGVTPPGHVFNPMLLSVMSVMDGTLSGRWFPLAKKIGNPAG